MCCDIVSHHFFQMDFLHPTKQTLIFLPCSLFHVVQFMSLFYSLDLEIWTHPRVGQPTLSHIISENCQIGENRHKIPLLTDY